MPTYEYACSSCGNVWEEVQRITADASDTCPKCGQKTAKRQINGGNFILKGGGWYADLYSSSKKPAASGAEAKGETKGEGKGETKSETKADGGTKSDSASGSSDSGSAAAPSPSASTSSGGSSGGTPSST